MGVFGRVDANQAHHAVVFVFEEMAVEDEGADGVRVAKIDTHFNLGIGEGSAVVKGNVDGVAEVRLV